MQQGIQRSIAVIGAGMAGLAVARGLTFSGHRVVVADKGRGLGGRMATRRMGALAFDHGAQYFTARGDAFRALASGLCASGAAAVWADGMIVGTPGMTAPARALAQGLTVVNGCEVKHLVRDAAGYTLLDVAGPAALPGNGSFDAVVVAVPASQAAGLLAASGVRTGAVVDAAACARMAPCWALLLAFDGRIDVADRIERDDGAIRWTARNASKPGRDRSLETFVVHGSPDWSRRHLELEAAEAARLLLAEFRGMTGAVMEPSTVVAHRWRYALVEEPAGVPCVWDGVAGIGACGDWFVAPRIEAAFDSGRVLAATMVGDFGSVRS